MKEEWGRGSRWEGETRKVKRMEINRNGNSIKKCWKHGQSEHSIPKYEVQRRLHRRERIKRRQKRRCEEDVTAVCGRHIPAPRRGM